MHGTFLAKIQGQPGRTILVPIQRDISRLDSSSRVQPQLNPGPRYRPKSLLHTPNLDFDSGLDLSSPTDLSPEKLGLKFVEDKVRYLLSISGFHLRLIVFLEMYLCTSVFAKRKTKILYNDLFISLPRPCTGICFKSYSTVCTFSYLHLFSLTVTFFN